MKNAGVHIDVAADSITIFGQEMKLETNASGLYTLKLRDLLENDDKEYKTLWQIIDDKNPEEGLRQLTKMHEGLGHPGMKKFEQMLKATNNYNNNVGLLLNKLYQ